MRGHNIWFRWDGSDEGSQHMVSMRWFRWGVTTYGFDEIVQMRGHNIWFRWEIRKNIIKYSLLSRALCYTCQKADVNISVVILSYCIEHSRRAILMRQRAARKKKPKETPETLLEGLDHYSRYGRRHAEDRKQSVASKALGMYVYLEVQIRWAYHDVNYKIIYLLLTLFHSERPKL